MPSELFQECFASHSSGCVRTCACGITYFDGCNDYDWSECEFEKLQRKAKREPSKYKETDHPVGTFIVSGEEIVIGCTCERGSYFEREILRHSHQIANYLNKRSERLRKEADATTVKQ